MHTRVIFWCVCVYSFLSPFFFAYSPLPDHVISTPLEWPSHLEGQKLTSIPLLETDNRFVSGFPGAIRKFHTQTSNVMIRWVTKPTRKLHPAIDCFRGAGYAVEYKPLWLDSENHHWGCFAAERGEQRVRVCERVYDRFGNEFTDVSAWYWNAFFHESLGPWWAVTVVNNESSDK